MLRKLLPLFLLTVFLAATTGFVLSQCCCDVTPKQECCRSASSKGCTTDVTYYKLEVKYQAAVAQQVSFFATAVLFLFDGSDFTLYNDFTTKAFNDSGPPSRIALTSLSRLQVFRI